MIGISQLSYKKRAREVRVSPETGTAVDFFVNKHVKWFYHNPYSPTLPRPAFRFPHPVAACVAPTLGTPLTST